MSQDDRAAEVRARNAAACPVIEAMETVGESWRLLVLYDLREGRKRFNELKRSTGARSRTLSDALDALTEAGLVEREQEPADPVAVYYDLTPKGEALQPVIDDLGAWAEEWDDPTVPEPIRQGAAADD